MPGMTEKTSLKQRIDEDLRSAMKAKDSVRLGTLRMVKAKMLEAEVALRGKEGRDYQLEDSEANQVLSTCAKQRRDSIESFEKGAREDLAAVERAELTIIEEYLPEQITSEQITQIVRAAIDSTGATSARDMGGVMKIVMPQVRGVADGKLVSKIAGGLLAGK